VYDIFFIGNSDLHWRRLKSRFPNARQIKVQGSLKTAIQQAKAQSFTPMFWAVWEDLIIKDSFDFNFKSPEWDHKYVHVFKNGEYQDGICLFSKDTNASDRELNYRFFFNKKEIDLQASTPDVDPFDIVFISYNETFADNNFAKLKSRFPDKTIHRVNGIKGIHQAHIKAAEQVSSKMFWVVDADAELVDEFTFDYQVVRHNYDAVHVWQSQNPINDLVYGYGGVKLLPTDLTRKVDINKPDMTTSIASKFIAVPSISNITAFNSDEFSAWRSAFRECVKLSSKLIDKQVDTETEERLEVWCSKGADRLYGEWALKGAQAGREYGKEHKGNSQALRKINDYDWLQEKYVNS
jgi:hypothetical protein